MNPKNSPGEIKKANDLLDKYNKGEALSKDDWYLMITVMGNTSNFVEIKKVSK